MARADPPLDTEPVGKILKSARGYAIQINFTTQDAAIAYAERHGIKTKITAYGF